MNKEKLCKARSKRSGRQCRRSVTPGYEVCHYHGAGSGPPLRNKNALVYGAYVNELLDEKEREIFERFYNRLHRDFELNESTDVMAAEMACVYFVRLIRAIKGDNPETIGKIDLLLSRKLAEIKGAKGKVEGKTDGSKTSPAEMASTVLARYRKQKKKSPKKKKTG